MQNLDKITDKIKADAQLRADKIMLDADAVCNKIIADAAEQAAAVVAIAEKNAKRDALATAQRAYSAADMKGRELVLAARVGLINKTFGTVYSRLTQLGDEDYCVFVAHLLADAALERIEAVNRLRSAYGDSEELSADFEVLFRREDLESRAPVIIKTAKAFLRKKSAALGKTPFTLSEEVADIDGGVILRYGDIETNCSIEAVVGDAKKRLEGRVAGMLFSPAEKAAGGDADDNEDQQL